LQVARGTDGLVVFDEERNSLKTGWHERFSKLDTVRNLPVTRRKKTAVSTNLNNLQRNVIHSYRQPPPTTKIYSKTLKKLTTPDFQSIFEQMIYSFLD
jgi:hypothetical protein